MAKCIEISLVSYDIHNRWTPEPDRYNFNVSDVDFLRKILLTVSGREVYAGKGRIFEPGTLILERILFKNVTPLREVPLEFRDYSGADQLFVFRCDRFGWNNIQIPTIDERGMIDWTRRAYPLFTVESEIVHPGTGVSGWEALFCEKS